MAKAAEQMLEGYKVLDFTHVLAGPTTSRYLAEMGAEVIKVELAPNGDMTRGLPFLRDGRSAYFIQQNRGKKSLCVDPKRAEGLALLKELAKKVDVLVENFAPGVIGRLGLDYATVSALNPRIVMCSISALGQTGPLADRPGFDWIGSAYSAVLDMTGFPDRTTVFPQAGVGDVSTGVHAMGAILAALLYRERTGKGQFVETSLLDCYFSFHEVNVQMLSASRGAMAPKRAGSHHYLVCPVGIFNGKQNPILIIAGLDAQWPAFCRAMDRPDLTNDPRFKDIASRSANAEELKGLVQDWIDGMPNDEEVMRRLEQNRIPYAPVLTVQQAMAHPHLRERGTIRTVCDRFLGEFEVPGFPLRFSEFPEPRDLEAPTLGQHNSEILGNYLGYSVERIRELEQTGVIRRGER
jgi:crotonobetainyl-CoA:carnitine CoA-transferase CaiB-like acyl-CoA transferase